MASKGMKALQVWCQQNTCGYAGVDVTNMTSSWKDGLAFCALIHRFRPDLIDFDSLSKENVLENNQLAFSVAEKELGIAALLDAEDMVTLKIPDKLSILTYLSQYYTYFQIKSKSSFENYRLPECQASVTNVPESSSNDEVNLKHTKPREDVNADSSHTLNFGKLQANTCDICHRKVHLVEKYQLDGKLYHRYCHRKKSLLELTPAKRTNIVSAKGQSADLPGIPPPETKTLPVICAVSINDSADKVLHSPCETAVIPGKVFECDNDILHANPVDYAKPFINKSSDHKDQEDLQQSKHAVDTKLPSLLDSLSHKTSLSDEHNMDYLNEMTCPSSISPTAPLISELSTAKPTPKPEKICNSGGSKSTPQPSPKSISCNKIQQGLQKTETNEENKESLNPFEKQCEKCDISEGEEDTNFNPFEEQPEKGDTGESYTLEDMNPFESDYDDDLNPFGSAAEYDDSLNPFGEELDDIEISQGRGLETNRFRNVECKSFSQNQSLNTVNTVASNLNPFNDQPSVSVVPPTSPVKSHKRAAPAPPINHQIFPHVKSSEKTPLTNPELQIQNKAASPRCNSKYNKGKAPDWKSIEKMEQVNKINSKNSKCINKFGNTTEQNVKSQPKVSSKQVDNQVSRASNSSRALKPAPGFGFPLVKREVKISLSDEDLASKMASVDLQLKELENRGIKLEEMLRDEMSSECDWKVESDQLLAEWFDLVHQKNKLVRKESALVYLMQQQKLEEQHADIEFKIRKLLNKPKEKWSEDECEEEKKLITCLLDIVERRNTIVHAIEEQRLKEEEEDMAYDVIKNVQRDTAKVSGSKHSPGSSKSAVPHKNKSPVKKKNKLKVKKFFSMKRENTHGDKSKVS